MGQLKCFFFFIIVLVTGKQNLLMPLKEITSTKETGLIENEESNQNTRIFPNDAFVFGPTIKADEAVQNIRTYVSNKLNEEELLHWSGYYSVSPYVSALLQMYQPSKRYKLKQLLHNVTTKFYNTVAGEDLHEKAATSSLLSILGKRNFSRFYTNFEKIFPASLRTSGKNPNLLSLHLNSTVMWLPFPDGESWGIGGAHPNDGASGPFNALDLAKYPWPPWGSTRVDWITSAHLGRVDVLSSCSIRVTDGSLSTSYYHLDNIMVTQNQIVSPNQRLGSYAKNKDQALCQGGHSTGPHLHFALWVGGLATPVNGQVLSGYTVHATSTTPYDVSHAVMWLAKNGHKSFAWSQISHAYSSDLDFGKTYRFRSFNYPNYMFRHRNYALWIDHIATDHLYIQDSSWKIVPGLAGEGISFQSVNYPAFYLRHSGYVAWIHQNDNSQLFKADASYIVHRGLAKGENDLSFESVNYRGHYLRHSGYRLQIAKYSNTDLFKQDASWIPIQSGCVDRKQSNGMSWYDSDGPVYDCIWYSPGSRCTTYGAGYSNFGMTADQACCTCGKIK